MISTQRTTIAQSATTTLKPEKDASLITLNKVSMEPIDAA
jgi:hypothetical protein